MMPKNIHRQNNDLFSAIRKQAIQQVNLSLKLSASTLPIFKIAHSLFHVFPCLLKQNILCANQIVIDAALHSYLSLTCSAWLLLFYFHVIILSTYRKQKKTGYYSGLACWYLKIQNFKYRLLHRQLDIMRVHKIILLLLLYIILYHLVFLPCPHVYYSNELF